MSEKESGTYTVSFSRVELVWLKRQLEGGVDRANVIINQNPTDVISSTPPTAEQIEKVKSATQQKDALLVLIKHIQEHLDGGERDRLALYNLRMDLEEARELVEEDSARDEIERRLKALPSVEEYRVQFDRATIKFTLKLVESDIERFSLHVIPNYEKSEFEQFKDPIQTKSYWVNKAKRSKSILESLRSKLERKL